MEEIIKDAKFNGKDVKIKVCASADQIEEAKANIKDLGAVVDNLTREPATMRSDTTNVLLPVYAIQHSTRAEIQPFAICVYAQINKNKDLEGFGTVALNSLNRVRYYYTNKILTEFNVKSYPKSQYGLPITSEISERLDNYLERICESYLQLEATGEKAVSINPAFVDDPNTGRKRMAFSQTDASGNTVRCREVERTLFTPVTKFEFLDEEKETLKTLAVKWLGK